MTFKSIAIFAALAIASAGSLKGSMKQFETELSGLEQKYSKDFTGMEQKAKGSGSSQESSTSTAASASGGSSGTSAGKCKVPKTKRVTLCMVSKTIEPPCGAHEDGFRS